MPNAADCAGLVLNDLHVYDFVANSWTDLSSSAAGIPPTARAFHGFASAGGKLYVYGGQDASKKLFGGLHSYDPFAMVWKDLSAPAAGTAPTARTWHGFTSANGMLYVHGGQDEYFNNLRDLYSYDPVAKVWADLSAPAGGTAPTARQRNGFTSAAGKLYVHGGLDANYNNYYLSDLHSFDPVAKVWTDLSSMYFSAPAGGTAPTARQGHGFTSADGKLYVHGGYVLNLGEVKDLHSFDPITNVWKDLSALVGGLGTLPTARYWHGFTSADGKLYVHGGYFSNGAACDDLHSFDPIAEVWKDLSAPAGGTVPTARWGHGFTSAEGKLYVHGGSSCSGNCPLDDLHSFDPVAKVWRYLPAAESAPVRGTAPKARYSHGFTSADGKLYVHGGLVADLVYVKDLHVFDPVTEVWTDLSAPAGGAAPTARDSHGFTSAEGKLYVHGGFVGGVGVANDLYSFDPVAKVWTDLSAPVGGTAPTARHWHGFTSADGKLYVHGGNVYNVGAVNDLHSFDPFAKVWTDLSNGVPGTPPAARYSHGFTSAGGIVYVHGGKGSWDGYKYPMFSDLHSFDPIAKVWKDLSARVASNAPAARYRHGFASVASQARDGRLYVHYGQDAAGCTLRLGLAAGLRLVLIISSA